MQIPAHLTRMTWEDTENSHRHPTHSGPGREAIILMQPCQGPAVCFAVRAHERLVQVLLFGRALAHQTFHKGSDRPARSTVLPVSGEQFWGGQALGPWTCLDPCLSC